MSALLLKTDKLTFAISIHSLKIFDGVKVQITDHGDGLTALLFLLLKESDLVAGIVSELEIVGEHTACKHLNPRHL